MRSPAPLNLNPLPHVTCARRIVITAGMVILVAGMPVLAPVTRVNCGRWPECVQPDTTPAP